MNHNLRLCIHDFCTTLTHTHISQSAQRDFSRHRQPKHPHRHPHTSTCRKNILCPQRERERERSLGVKMGVGKGNISEECVGDGVYIYTLERGGVRAVFTNWGATLMSLCVPDAQGARKTHNT